jgi:hypothetical protein
VTFALAATMPETLRRAVVTETDDAVEGGTGQTSTP